MKLAFLSFLLCLATAALSQDLAAQAKPKPPNLTFLFSANLTIAEPIDIGATPFGQQVVVQVKDGHFSGPNFEGEFFSYYRWRHSRAEPPPSPKRGIVEN